MFAIVWHFIPSIPSLTKYIPRISMYIRPIMNPVIRYVMIVIADFQDQIFLSGFLDKYISWNMHAVVFALFCGGSIIS